MTYICSLGVWFAWILSMTGPAKLKVWSRTWWVYWGITTLEGLAGFLKNRESFLPSLIRWARRTESLLGPSLIILASSPNQHLLVDIHCLSFRPLLSKVVGVASASPGEFVTNADFSSIPDPLKRNLDLTRSITEVGQVRTHAGIGVKFKLSHADEQDAPTYQVTEARVIPGPPHSHRGCYSFNSDWQAKNMLQ